MATTRPPVSPFDYRIDRFPLSLDLPPRPEDPGILRKSWQTLTAPLRVVGATQGAGGAAVAGIAGLSGLAQGDYRPPEQILEEARQNNLREMGVTDETAGFVQKAEAVPGAGDVVWSQIPEAWRETRAGRMLGQVGRIAGNMAGDPLSYVGGTLVRGAGKIASAGRGVKAVDAGADAGRVLETTERLTAAQRLAQAREGVKEVLGSGLGAVPYIPEIAEGTAAGLGGAWNAARKGEYADAGEQLTSGLLIGGLGALAGKGIYDDVAALKGAWKDKGLTIGADTPVEVNPFDPAAGMVVDEWHGPGGPNLGQKIAEMQAQQPAIEVEPEVEPEVAPEAAAANPHEIPTPDPAEQLVAQQTMQAAEGILDPEIMAQVHKDAELLGQIQGPPAAGAGAGDGLPPNAAEAAAPAMGEALPSPVLGTEAGLGGVVEPEGGVVQGPEIDLDPTLGGVPADQTGMPMSVFGGEKGSPVMEAPQAAEAGANVAALNATGMNLPETGVVGENVPLGGALDWDAMMAKANALSEKQFAEQGVPESAPPDVEVAAPEPTPKPEPAPEEAKPATEADVDNVDQKGWYHEPEDDISYEVWKKNPGPEGTFGEKVVKKKGKYSAYDKDGQYVGEYPTLAKAQEAIDKTPLSGDNAGGGVKGGDSTGNTQEALGGAAPAKGVEGTGTEGEGVPIPLAAGAPAQGESVVQTAVQSGGTGGEGLAAATGASGADAALAPGGDLGSTQNAAPQVQGPAGEPGQGAGLAPEAGLAPTGGLAPAATGGGTQTAGPVDANQAAQPGGMAGAAQAGGEAGAPEGVAPKPAPKPKVDWTTGANGSTFAVFGKNNEQLIDVTTYKKATGGYGAYDFKLGKYLGEGDQLVVPANDSKTFATDEEAMAALEKHLQAKGDIEAPAPAPAPASSLKWSEPIKDGMFAGTIGTKIGAKSIEIVPSSDYPGKFYTYVAHDSDSISPDGEATPDSHYYDTIAEAQAAVEKYAQKQGLAASPAAAIANPSGGYNPATPPINPSEGKVTPPPNLTPPSLGKTSPPNMDSLELLPNFGPKGSAPGDYYRDTKTNDIWYVKQYQGDTDTVVDRIAQENLANNLYRKLGLIGAETWRVDQNGAPAIASRYMHGLKKLDLDNPPSDAFTGFAADAWLANWDVIGKDADNAFLDKDGRIVRLDSGGALEYRAMGSKKGHLFGNLVPEMVSMRNSTTGVHNPTAHKIFGKMSDQDVLNSINYLTTRISGPEIKQIVKEHGLPDALGAKLANRLDAIKEYRNTLENEIVAKDKQAKLEAELAEKFKGMPDWYKTHGVWSHPDVVKMAVWETDPGARPSGDNMGAWIAKWYPGVDPRKMTSLEKRKMGDAWAKHRAQMNGGSISTKDYDTFPADLQPYLTKPAKELKELAKSGLHNSAKAQAALLYQHLQKIAKEGAKLVKTKGKNWWKESAVVDEKGEPMIVQHSGPKFFTEFDPNKVNSGHTDDNNWFGFYFEGSPYVNTFPGHGEGTNGRYYLSIQNPYVVTHNEFYDYPFPGKIDQYGVSKSNTLAIKKKLIELGYDGIRVVGRGKHGHGHAEWQADQWVPFHPVQIKAAVPLKPKLGTKIGDAAIKLYGYANWSGGQYALKNIGGWLKEANTAVSEGMKGLGYGGNPAINPQKLGTFDIHDKNIFHSVKMRDGSEATVIPGMPNSSFMSTVKKLLPNIPHTITAEGALFRLPNGQRILVSETGKIDFDPGRVAATHGADMAEKVMSGQAQVAGVTIHYADGFLVKAVDSGELPHEVAHVFLEGFATGKERLALERAFEDAAKKSGRAVDEEIADGYRSWWEGRDKARPINGDPRVGFFKRIYNYLRDLYRAFVPNKDSIFRQIESGEAFQRVGSNRQAPRGEVREPGTLDRPQESYDVKDKPAGSPDKASSAVPGGLSDEEIMRLALKASDESIPLKEGKPSKTPDANINPDYISTNDRVADFTRRMMDDPLFDKAEGGARGAARPWEEVRAKAISLGLDPDDIAKLYKRKGGMLSDVELESATGLRNEITERALKTWDEIQKLKTSEPDKAETLRQVYDGMIAQLGSLNFAIAGARAEAARALALARKMGEPLDAYTRKLIRAARLANVDDATRNKLAEAIAKKDAAALKKLQNKLLKADWFDKLVEFWRAGLLTGPPTHIVNFVSNAAKAGAIDPFESFAAGAFEALGEKIGTIRPEHRERFMGESKAMLRGARNAIPEASTQFLRDVIDIFKLDYEEKRPIDVSGKFENIGKIEGKKGEAVRVSFHLLNAADDFWKKIIEQQTVSRLAYRQAKRAGLSGQGMEDYIKKFEGQYAVDRGLHKDNPKDSTVSASFWPTWKQVESAMERGTYQEDLPEGMKHLTIAMSKHPWSYFIIPFAKTPYNIARATAYRTIPGLLVSSYRAKVEGGKGEARVIDSGADRLAMATTGTLLMGTIYWLMETQDGMEITGNGPTDPVKLEAKKRTGWQPLSIKIGDTYIPYGRLEPLSSLIGMVADARELGDLKKNSERVEKGIALVQENLTNKTFLSGLESFITAWHDPKRYLGQFIKQLEASLVPASALSRRITQATDPTVRKTGGPFDFTTSEQTGIPMPEAVAANIPGLSRSLPARRDPTGQDIVRPGEGVAGAAERLVSPFPRSKAIYTPQANVIREMERIDAVQQQPKQTITLRGGKTITLNPTEYAMVQDSYKKAAERVSRAMQTDFYRSAPDTDEEAGPNERSKQDIIRGIYRDARNDARKRIYQIPAFRQRAARVQRGLEPGS